MARLRLNNNNTTSHMNKSDLIARIVRKQPQFSVADAKIIVETILGAMAESMAQGRRIKIHGFGSFGISSRPARSGPTPKSAAKIGVLSKQAPRLEEKIKLRQPAYNTRKAARIELT